MLLCKRISVIYRTNSCISAINQITNNLKEMPSPSKQQKAALIAYKSRQEKAAKYAASNKNVSIEVIGSGSHGSPRSVHICTDNCRYLFNCGEGTQRLSNEYKIKLSKSPNIFITYPSWENVSGLLGLALTLQSIGIPELYLHGPKLVENVFSATNKFVALRTIDIKMMDYINYPEFDDGIIKIKAVPLIQDHTLHKNTSDSTLAMFESTSNDKAFDNAIHENVGVEDDDDIDYYSHLTVKKNKKHANKVKNRSQSVECKRKEHQNKKIAVSYICQTKETLGTLLIEKCVELNVPCGPLLGKLKNGENIVLENGIEIKSSDVTTPNLPGAIIIVVECPTEDFLDALLHEPAFYRHQTGHEVDLASAIIHFTNSKIIENPKYKEWINRFPKSTKHLFINGNNKSFGSVAVQRLQYKLNLLHPQIFPLLSDCGIPEYPRKEENINQLGHNLVIPKKKKEQMTMGAHAYSNSDEKYTDKIFFSCQDNSFIAGQTLCQLYIRPIFDYDYSKSLVLKKEHFINEVMGIEGFKEKLHQFWNSLKDFKLEKERYPKILFLGTGSSKPDKIRNTSGILVFLDKKNYILLDCGEGTYGQIVQFYGEVKAKEILRNLNVIYVSHLHADHHMGLITLLKERFLAINEQSQADGTAIKFQPVHVMAPIQLSRWLNLYSNDFESISHLYSLIPNSNLVNPIPNNCKYEGYLKLLNLKELRTTLVDHCPNAFGVAITHNDGWKLTYSGDTRPCQNLVDLGMNSDILIHEATMDDSLEKLARIKLHSTSSQAIQIGKAMKAKYIILTHFSQRYSHIPLFSESFTDEVGIAFDNMIVSLDQLPILSKLKPVLKAMFSEQYEEMEQKKMLQMLKQKRRSLSRSPEESRKRFRSASSN